MKPAIKNEKIKSAIDFENKNKVFASDVATGSQAYSEASVEQVALNMMWGYVSSLIEVSEYPEVNIDLDLTYATVNNLMTVVAYEFMFGMNPDSGYTEKQNLEIAAKSVAAYLIFLALNEHDTKMSIPIPKTMDENRVFSPDTWSGLEVKLCNTLIFTDLLKFVYGDTKFENGHLIINMDKVISGYKSVTGKDLKTLGVDSVDVSFK